MAKDRNGTLSEKSKSPNREEDKEERKSKSKQRENVHPEKKMRENPESESGEERKHSRSKGKARESSDSESEDQRKLRKSEGRKRKSRKRYSSEEDSDSDGADSGSESSDSGDSESESLGSEESEEERKRRKRRERRRRREREEERERKMRKKEKERKMRRREKEEEKKKKKRRKEKKKEKMEKGKKGAVTNSWGKYGIIRETDMWTKRPEFTAWLAEVKQVNLESLPNWEEKQMFKAFMEDHNTATFPSKKYYNLDAYYRRKMEKEQQKGFKKVLKAERIVFNDEEQRRLELLQEREKHKEEQVEVLKRSMQGGMAQAMKEQALLREEMALQYKLGNSEAAAAIQRRLDPDVAM